MNYQKWQRMNQTFEAGFWGDCANTYAEETKQIAYARVMGLVPGTWEAGEAWPWWDLQGASVVDFGGGPTSLLLKCVGLGTAIVVDPCPYPDWVAARYEAHGVTLVPEMGEDFSGGGFDEAWCYNVLQHVSDPRMVTESIKAAAPRRRVFEWIDVKPHPGHPHELKAHLLEEWYGAEGQVVLLDAQYRETFDGFQRAWGGCLWGE